MARITDELRDGAKTLTHWWYDPVKDEYTYTTGIMPPSIDAIRLDSSIIAIADRIDAEFKAACESEYAAGVMSVPIAVDESKWVKLPVDADGEVWNVGDFVVGEVNPRNPKAIERMIWYGPDSGWQLETDNIIYPCPDRPRHHHAPTVEDVLREFAERYLDYEGVPSAGRRGIGEALMDEYASRLRLAGDAE